MNDQDTQAKITARNRVNRAITELSPAMRKALLPFVGQKVCTVDGTLLLKVLSALPEPRNTIALQIFYTTGHGYSIRASFRCAESVPNGGTQYAESDSYLGDLDTGVLTKIYPDPTYRSNYTLEEVKALKRAVDSARDVYNSLQSELSVIL